MQPSDAKAFTEVLTAAFEIYNKSASPTQIEIYWESLKKFDFADVRKAFSRHIQDADSGQWLPKPADIIRALEGTTTDRASMAWSQVLQCVRSVGGYQSVVFDDPATHYAIAQMGGWCKLNEMLEKDTPFRRNEFLNHFKTHLRKPELKYPAKLIGYSEASNSREGFQCEPPKLIGNPEKAQRVLEHGKTGGMLQVSTAKPADYVALLEKAS